MYILLVLLLLLFITFYPRIREGLEPIDDEDVFNKPSILTTATDIQIPNYVSGTRGKDLQFAGGILLEKDNTLELGKGYNKGDNAGTLQYNNHQLDIYGGGEPNTPYKMKLWDNVEVGKLLQVNESLHFGRNTASNEANVNVFEGGLTIAGRNVGGVRKVQIWDEVEVGKLMSNNGIEVRGPVNAYNDLNVEGKLFAKKGIAVTGDMDIAGNINNAALNQRLAKLEESQPMPQESTPVQPVQDVSKKIDESVLNELTSNFNASLEKVMNQIKMETNTQIADRFKNLRVSDTPTDPVNLTKMDLMMMEYDTRFANISENLKEWNAQKGKLMKWANVDPNDIDFGPDGNLAALSNTNGLNFAKLSEISKSTLDFGPQGKLASLANGTLVNANAANPATANAAANPATAATAPASRVAPARSTVAATTGPTGPSIESLAALTYNMSRDVDNLKKAAAARLKADLENVSSVLIDNMVVEWNRTKQGLFASRDAWENASNLLIRRPEFAGYQINVSLSLTNLSEYTNTQNINVSKAANDKLNVLRGQVETNLTNNNTSTKKITEDIVAINSTLTNLPSNFVRTRWNTITGGQSSEVKTDFENLSSRLKTINDTYMKTTDANNTYLRPPTSGQPLIVPNGILLGNNTANKWKLEPGISTLTINKQP